MIRTIAAVKRNIIKIALSGICAMTLFVPALQAATLDTIVAVVNEAVITQSQLNQEITLAREQMLASHTPVPPPAVLRQKMLQSLINKQLQLQVAKKEGLTVSDADVDHAIDRIAQGNGITAQQLKIKVQQQGINYDKYRNEIREQMIISQLQQREVAPKVVITEQEVTDFLPTMKKQLATKPAAHVVQSGQVIYHVQDYLIALPENPTPQQVSDALQKAQVILTKLRAGEDMQKQKLLMADLGWRKADDLPTLFVASIKPLSVGGFAGPVRAPNGYHILKLVGLRGGDTAAPANSTPANFGTMTHVEHILIKTTPLLTDDQVKAKLEKIRASILAGASFAQLARDNSQDPGSAGKGGDLGWVPQGVLDPVFQAQMNRLKPGEISQPFKSSFGWHILEVLGRKNQAGSPQFLRDQARQLLYGRKYDEALQNWLRQVRSQSYVKIMNGS